MSIKVTFSMGAHEGVMLIMDLFMCGSLGAQGLSDAGLVRMCYPVAHVGNTPNAKHDNVNEER